MMDKIEMSTLRYKRCTAMGMTNQAALELPEKLSADHLEGVDGVQERLGNGHKRVSVDEAEGEACIVCRFVPDNSHSHLHPHLHFHPPCIRSMLGVNVLGICSPCQMFLSDSVEESSQDTISCMRGSDCQVLVDVVVLLDVVFWLNSAVSQDTISCMRDSDCQVVVVAIIAAALLDVVFFACQASQD